MAAIYSMLRLNTCTLKWQLNHLSLEVRCTCSVCLKFHFPWAVVFTRGEKDSFRQLLMNMDDSWFFRKAGFSHLSNNVQATNLGSQKCKYKRWAHRSFKSISCTSLFSDFRSEGAILKKERKANWQIIILSSLLLSDKGKKRGPHYWAI